jgi:uncharacterized membrane protein
VAVQQQTTKILVRVSDEAESGLVTLKGCGTIVVTLWVMVIQGVKPINRSQSAAFL